MKAVLLSFLAVAATATAAVRPVPEGYASHEKRDFNGLAVPKKGDRLSASTVLPMRIGLAQNEESLDKAAGWLMDVSHPKSARYGQHWTSEEVIRAFEPSKDSVNVVVEWLSSAGIAKERITHSDNKLWLAFDASAEEAESLLHADFHEYAHPKGHTMVGCDEVQAE